MTVSITLGQILAQLGALAAQDATLGPDEHAARAEVRLDVAAVWRLVPLATDLPTDDLGQLLLLAAEIVADRSTDAALVCRVMADMAP